MRTDYKVALQVSHMREGDTLLVEALADNGAEHLSVGITLLLLDLIDSLHLVDARDRYRISIRKKGIAAEPRCSMESLNAGGLDLSVHPVELEYWQKFFLEYVRDGGGTVDHVDVDIPVLTKELRDISLRLAVPVPSPFVSAEARHILGT